MLHGVPARQAIQETGPLDPGVASLAIEHLKSVPQRARWAARGNDSGSEGLVPSAAAHLVQVTDSPAYLWVHLTIMSDNRQSAGLAKRQSVVEPRLRAKIR